MAVERIGTYTSNTDNADGSFSVTVPSDADIAVLITTGYPGSTSATNFYDELNWDNGATLDFTEIIGKSWYTDNTGLQIEAHYMTSDDTNWPGSGAKTLYFSSSNTYGEGYLQAVLFYKGVDTSDPIVDTDSEYGQSTSGDWTSSLTGVGANDMGVVASYYYQTQPTTWDFATNGQTEVYVSSVYRSASLSIGEELGEDALVIDTSGNNYVPIAFALTASSGATTYTETSTANAFLKKSDNTKTSTANAYLQSVDKTLEPYADSYLSLTSSSVERIIGYGGPHQAQNDGSTGLIVPSDADALVVLVVGSPDAAAPIFDKLNWDNGSTVDFTQILSLDPGLGYAVLDSYYMTSDDTDWPGAGTHSVYFSSTNTYDEGFHILYAFYKNVNKNNTIGTTDTHAVTSANWTSTNLTDVDSDDMTIGLVYQAGTTTSGIDLNVNSQTVIRDTGVAYNGCFAAFGEKLGETAFRSDWASGDNGQAPAVFILKATDSATSDKTLTVTADAYLQSVDKTLTATADAQLEQFDKTLTASGEGYLKLLDKTLTANADGYLDAGATEYTATSTANAFLQLVDKTLTAGGEGYLNLLDKTLTASADGYLDAGATEYTATSTANAYLQSVDKTLTVGGDSYLKAFDKTLTASADGQLLAGTEYTVTSTANAYLKIFDQALTSSANAYLRLVDQTLTATADGYMSAAYTDTATANAYLQSVDKTLTAGGDSYLKAFDKTLTATADGQLTDLATIVKVGIFDSATGTSTGTKDFTATGLDSVTATGGIFFYTNVPEFNTTVSDAKFGIGWTDGTTHYCSVATAEDGVANADCHSLSEANLAVSCVQGTGTVNGRMEFDSFISGGIRGDITDAFPGNYIIRGLLFGGGGLSIKSGSVAAQSGTGSLNVTDVGFEPDIVFCSTVMLTGLSDDYNNAFVSLGVARNTGSAFANHSMQYYSQDNTAAAKTAGRASATYAGGDAYASAQFYLSDPDSQGFTFNHDAGATERVFYLAVKLSNWNTSLFSLDVPTSTGTQALTTPTFTPSVIFEAFNRCTAFDTEQEAGQATAVGVALSDSSSEYTFSITDEDGAASMNTRSIAYGTGLRIYEDDGSTLHAESTIDSFDADGYTRDWTTVPGTATKMFSLCLAPPVSSKTLTATANAYLQSVDQTLTVTGDSILSAAQLVTAGSNAYLKLNDKILTTLADAYLDLAGATMVSLTSDAYLQAVDRTVTADASGYLSGLGTTYTVTTEASGYIYPVLTTQADAYLKKTGKVANVGAEGFILGDSSVWGTVATSNPQDWRILKYEN